MKDAGQNKPVTCSLLCCVDKEKFLTHSFAVSCNDPLIWFFVG